LCRFGSRKIRQHGILNFAVGGLRAVAPPLSVSACNFVNWDNHGRGSPAIELDGGKAIVQGCSFESPGTHVQVLAAVKSAILTGNQADGGFKTDNKAGKRTQTLANEQPDPKGE
jgi:hypothetical protein